MTSSLESRLTDELRRAADQVGDLPEAAERAISGAYVVRRRRAIAGSLGIVAAAVLVAGLALGDNGGKASAPPATSTPSPSATLSAGLMALAKGEMPQTDYVVGSTAHLAGRSVTLPADWVVTDLVHAGDGWVVAAQTSDEPVIAQLTAQGDLSQLARETAMGLAVDPTGRYVAWGSEHPGGPAQERLTAYDLTARAVIARRKVHYPVKVEGWAREGVIASYRVDPGGSPIVWDPRTDAVTPVWGGAGAGPTFVAYSPTGHLWVLADTSSGCPVLLTRLGDAATSGHCTASLQSPAAFFDDARSLAVTSGSTVRIVDRGLADIGDASPLPRDVAPLQILPAGGAELLVVVADAADGSSHVLGCTGSGPCVRDLDAPPGQQIWLAQP